MKIDVGSEVVIDKGHRESVTGIVVGFVGDMADVIPDVGPLHRIVNESRLTAI